MRIRNNKAIKPKSEPFNSVVPPLKITSTTTLKIIFINLSKNYKPQNQMILFFNKSEMKKPFGTI